MFQGKFTDSKKLAYPEILNHNWISHYIKNNFYNFYNTTVFPLPAKHRWKKFPHVLSLWNYNMDI